MRNITRRYLKDKWPGNHAMHELIDYIPRGPGADQLTETIINIINNTYVQNITNIIEGNNITFPLDFLANINTLRVYRNGMRCQPNVEYTVTPVQIEFVNDPENQLYLPMPGEEIKIIYEPFLKSATFMPGEVPAGVIDGVNKEFTLTNYPDPNHFELYYVKQLQKPRTDYTLSGNKIIYTRAPLVNDFHVTDYYYAAAPGSRSFNIVPAGVINGVNNEFTVPGDPSAIMLYRNGPREQEDVDFTFAAGTITTNIALEVGEWLLADLVY